MNSDSLLIMKPKQTYCVITIDYRVMVPTDIYFWYFDGTFNHHSP
ncbi:hypothetical protein B6N60_02790 [Richelia sinica FACHB-800]|uniref:Uncharacterized protein n=1 Tax=Richelia sinica FACHB-800 TaxID=1357546 RepID=A0A975Y5D0_9NOST|nr:hypothetical protein B6N60_02790 [Richelia sinica FACHB-800]